MEVRAGHCARTRPKCDGGTDAAIVLTMRGISGRSSRRSTGAWTSSSRSRSPPRSSSPARSSGSRQYPCGSRGAGDSGSGIAKFQVQQAKARLTFTGRSVAYAGTMAGNRGKAEVRLDGVKVAVVDLYSPSIVTKRRVFARNFASSAPTPSRCGSRGRRTPPRPAYG